jgi:hypothetical protein
MNAVIAACSPAPVVAIGVYDLRHGLSVGTTCAIARIDVPTCGTWRL